jgi:hypothetical protein
MRDTVSSSPHTIGRHTSRFHHFEKNGKIWGLRTSGWNNIITNGETKFEGDIIVDLNLKTLKTNSLCLMTSVLLMYYLFPFQISLCFDLIC